MTNPSLKRQKIAEVIFMEINYCKTVNEAHPDWTYIRDKLGQITEADLMKFYDFLWNFKADETSNTLTRKGFIKAFNSYMDNFHTELFFGKKIFEKAEVMGEKLLQVWRTIVENEGVEYGEQYFIQADLTKATIVENEEKKDLFTNEEKRVFAILNKKELFNKIRDVNKSLMSLSRIWEDIILPAWKTIVVADYMGESTPRVTALEFEKPKTPSMPVKSAQGFKNVHEMVTLTLKKM